MSASTIAMLQRRTAPKGRFAAPIDFDSPLDAPAPKARYLTHPVHDPEPQDDVALFDPSDAKRRAHQTRLARAAARAAGPEALAQFEAQHASTVKLARRACTIRYSRRENGPLTTAKAKAMSAGRLARQAATDAGPAALSLFLADREEQRKQKLRDYNDAHRAQKTATERRRRLLKKFGVNKARRKAGAVPAAAAAMAPEVAATQSSGIGPSGANAFLAKPRASWCDPRAEGFG